MKQSLIIIGVIYIVSAPVCAVEWAPKVYCDYEAGERTSTAEFDNDFIDILAEEEARTYSYNIFGVGIKQKTPSRGLFSLSYKQNEKEYDYSFLPGQRLDNVSRKVAGYYRFDLSKTLILKLEGYLKEREFSDKLDESNDWASGSASCTVRPENTNFFFTSSRNEYLIKATFKNVEYDAGTEKNFASQLYMFRWKIGLDNFRIISRLRYYAKDFDQTSLSRRNSTNASYKLRLEYDFQ